MIRAHSPAASVENVTPLPDDTEEDSVIVPPLPAWFSQYTRPVQDEAEGSVHVTLVEAVYTTVCLVSSNVGAPDVSSIPAAKEPAE